jgi:hypothetical protein
LARSLADSNGSIRSMERQETKELRTIFSGSFSDNNRTIKIFSP